MSSTEHPDTISTKIDGTAEQSSTKSDTAKPVHGTWDEFLSIAKSVEAYRSSLRSLCVEWYRGNTATASKAFETEMRQSDTVANSVNKANDILTMISPFMATRENIHLLTEWTEPITSDKLLFEAVKSDMEASHAEAQRLRGERDSTWKRGSKDMDSEISRLNAEIAEMKIREDAVRGIWEEFGTGEELELSEAREDDR